MHQSPTILVSLPLNKQHERVSKTIARDNLSDRYKAHRRKHRCIKRYIQNECNHYRVYNYRRERRQFFTGILCVRNAPQAWQAENHRWAYLTMILASRHPANARVWRPPEKRKPVNASAITVPARASGIRMVSAATLGNDRRFDNKRYACHG